MRMSGRSVYAGSGQLRESWLAVQRGVDKTDVDSPTTGASVAPQSSSSDVIPEYGVKIMRNEPARIASRTHT